MLLCPPDLCIYPEEALAVQDCERFCFCTLVRNCVNVPAGACGFDVYRRHLPPMNANLLHHRHHEETARRPAVVMRPSGKELS